MRANSRKGDEVAAQTLLDGNPRRHPRGVTTGHFTFVS